MQAAREFSDEGAGHGRVRPGHVGDGQDQALGVGGGHLGHQVGPMSGAVAVYPAYGEAGRDPAQILDQGQTQHDGDGPQLAEFQGRHGLVGGHEAAQIFRVHAAVAVRDRLHGEVVDPRQAGGVPSVQLRKLTAVALG
ncbi:hypothetical protein DSECCO2_362070 [anaerobic digester metagenome]